MDSDRSRAKPATLTRIHSLHRNTLSRSFHSRTIQVFWIREACIDSVVFTSNFDQAAALAAVLLCGSSFTPSYTAYPQQSAVLCRPQTPRALRTFYFWRYLHRYEVWTCSKHPFLEYDSYVDCTSLYTFQKVELTALTYREA